MAVSKACFAVDLCFKEIYVDDLASDVMAGAGGAAGPVPDICHQPPGKTVIIYCHYDLFTSSLVVQW